jgi:hypothetical protein
MLNVRHVLCFLALVATAALGKVEGTAQLSPIDSPAGPSSGEPNLFTAPDGRVFLSWIEKTSGNHHALRFAVRQANKWSEPRTVSEGDNWFVNWADFPSLVVASDGSLVAHWLVKAGPDAYAYNINISRSTDVGRTWGKPLVPHRDATLTEHGFVSMLPLDGGRVGAAWLDGRNFSKVGGNGGHDGHGPSANDMTLRWAAIDRSGALSEEALLDARVCECCQTSGAITSVGPVIAYRDRSSEEVRDISIVRQVKGQWTEPRSVHADGWRIEGCPVNGPSVAADGKRLIIAWFTAAKNSPAVNVVFSNDAGASFGKAIRVDDGSPVGRVDVQMLADGTALVCWLERTAGGGAVKSRRVRPDGSQDPAFTVTEASTARSSGFPRITRAANEMIFAWTENGSPSRVRVATIKLEGR